MNTLSRRSLLRGRWSRPAPAQRPPWAVDEQSFIDGCTRCHECIGHCESGVLISGPGGFPAIDFQRAECTFCRKCAEVCPQPVFDLQQARPWTLTASIQGHCLTQKGVECRACQDACEPYAIRFTPHVSGIAKPVLDPSLCTGCGACVGNCPVGAVDVVPGQQPLPQEAALPESVLPNQVLPNQVLPNNEQKTSLTPGNVP